MANLTSATPLLPLARRAPLNCFCKVVAGADSVHVNPKKRFLPSGGKERAVHDGRIEAGVLARRRHDGRGEECLVHARAAHDDEADDHVARAGGDGLTRVQELARVHDEVALALGARDDARADEARAAALERSLGKSRVLWTNQAGACIGGSVEEPPSHHVTPNSFEPHAWKRQRAERDCKCTTDKRPR